MATGMGLVNWIMTLADSGMSMVTMTNAASIEGTRFCCSHSIGRTVINAKNAAIRNGTNRTDIICMP